MSDFTSDFTWVTNGFEPGPDTTLEALKFATLLTSMPVVLPPTPTYLPSEIRANALPVFDPSRFSTALSPLAAAMPVLRDVSGQIVVPSTFGAIALGQGHTLSLDEDTLAGRITPSLSGKILDDFSLTLSGATQTFTGADMRLIIEVADPPRIGDAHPRYAKQILESTTLTVSVHRATAPARALGYINPKGFAKATRTIAGTMIFTQFTAEVLMRFLQSILMSDKSKDSYFTKIDQLPRFNITMMFANELGYASMRRLLGVVFVTDGVVYSIQDMLSEQTISYMCADFTPLLPLTHSNLFQPTQANDPSTSHQRSPMDVITTSTSKARTRYDRISGEIHAEDRGRAAGLNETQVQSLRDLRLQIQGNR